MLLLSGSYDYELFIFFKTLFFQKKNFIVSEFSLNKKY